MLFTLTAFAADWTVLQTDQVLVRCRDRAAGQRCEASAHLDRPMAAIRASIEDLAGYPERFQSIVDAHRDPAGRIVLTFALPTLLGGWTVTSEPHAWQDPSGWHLTLQVVESHGRTALFDHLAFDVLPVDAGTDVTLAWTHTLAWPRWIRDRITRQQGHNLVWGVALGAGGIPVAAAVAADPTTR
jgi:hypothetical protein